MEMLALFCLSTNFNTFITFIVIDTIVWSQPSDSNHLYIFGVQCSLSASYKHAQKIRMTQKLVYNTRLAHYQVVHGVVPLVYYTTLFTRLHIEEMFFFSHNIFVKQNMLHVLFLMHISLLHLTMLSYIQLLTCKIKLIVHKLFIALFFQINFKFNKLFYF